MKSRFAIVVALLAGLVLGAVGDHVWQGRGTSASAAAVAPMSMSNGASVGMTSMPIGDAQMMKAMNKMNGAMKGVHLNGDQDHDFMQMMIPHHQGAIEMAQVELRYGIQPQLKTMARDIIKGQTAEITQMRQWLCKWDADCKSK